MELFIGQILPLFLFLSEQGKPYQYLAIRVDITNRKEAEKYLIQRTDQLGIAKKELAFQNKEKEESGGGISHH